MQQKMCKQMASIIKLGIVFSAIQNAVQSAVVASPLFGSARLGKSFDDTVSTKAEGVHSLNVSYGAIVFGLQASYYLHSGDVVQGAVHGTIVSSILQKSLTTIVFQKEEKIIRIEGATDEIYGYITQLKIYTKLSDDLIKSYGPFGTGRNSSDISFSIAGIVSGLFGRSDHFINALGAYTDTSLPPGLNNKTQMVGGTFGEPFDDYAAARLYSDQARLLNLTISTEPDGYIYGFRAVYLFPNGTHFVADHGKSGGPDKKIITFRETEKMVQTDVAIFSLFVNYLTFSTLDSRGTRKTYGPYGGLPLSNITTIQGTVYGFFGKVGIDHNIIALTGLGCYV